MKFRLNINITEKDYYDYNSFWLLKSPYGKKQLISHRWLYVAIFAVAIVAVILIAGITPVTVAGIVILLLQLLFFEAILPKMMVKSTYKQIKRLKKQGKMAFSPSSVMEFYEDYFTDESEYAKTEQKYSVIERVSIVDGKTLYIHINNLSAFIIPFYVFESEEECRAFIDFIKTKSPVVDVY